MQVEELDADLEATSEAEVMVSKVEVKAVVSKCKVKVRPKVAK